MPKSYRQSKQVGDIRRKDIEHSREDRSRRKGSCRSKPCVDAGSRRAVLYGLRNKREIWRVQLALAKIRKAARILLTLEENHPKRLFEGRALLNRMFKFGLLNKQTENGSTIFWDSPSTSSSTGSLQTVVQSLKMSQSIHQARTKIHDRHVAVNNQLVTAPSFLVTVASENAIQYHIASSWANPTTNPSRKAKFNKKNGKTA
jgi:small subunit ribosomal protein S9e